MIFHGSYKAARALCKKREIPIHAHVHSKGEVHLMVVVTSPVTLVRKVGELANGEALTERSTLQPGPRVLRVRQPYPVAQGAS